MASDLIFLSSRVVNEIRRSAPPDSLAVAQTVLRDFDRQAARLLECALKMSPDEESAREAVHTAFRAYRTALRDGGEIGDSRTWLLLSVLALLLPSPTVAKPWSFLQAHPPIAALIEDPPGARLREHLAACGSCFLSRGLALHLPDAQAEPPTASRDRLLADLDQPDDLAFFLAYAERMAKVARLAASEMRLLLGANAGRSWICREASVGTWLGTFLGTGAQKASA